MRKRALPFAAAVVLTVALTASAGARTAASGARPYSQAWLAQNHSKYDTPLTAAYERTLHASTSFADESAPLIGNVAVASCSSSE